MVVAQQADQAPALLEIICPHTFDRDLTVHPRHRMDAFAAMDNPATNPMTDPVANSTEVEVELPTVGEVTDVRGPTEGE